MRKGQKQQLIMQRRLQRKGETITMQNNNTDIRIQLEKRMHYLENEIQVLETKLQVTKNKYNTIVSMSETQQGQSPAALEPVAPEPVAPEPVAPEPVALEPVAPEPVAPEPAAPEPVAPEPVALEPVALEPVAPEPAALEPVALEPVAPEPVAPEPVALEPATNSTLLKEMKLEIKAKKKVIEEVKIEDLIFKVSEEGPAEEGPAEEVVAEEMVSEEVAEVVAEVVPEDRGLGDTSPEDISVINSIKSKKGKKRGRKNKVA
tara:strand:- start:366 stop:1148 length:783 start_codon:yes stop_codon:yes gene_type:complete